MKVPAQQIWEIEFLFQGARLFTIAVEGLEPALLKYVYHKMCLCVYTSIHLVACFKMCLCVYIYFYSSCSLLQGLISTAFVLFANSWVFFWISLVHILRDLNIAIYVEKGFVGIPQGLIKLSVINTKSYRNFHGFFLTEFRKRKFRQYIITTTMPWLITTTTQCSLFQCTSSRK